MHEQLFQVVNTVALLSWVFLIIFPYKIWSRKVLLFSVIIGLAALYLLLAIQHFDSSTFSNFNSLSGISSLFSDPINVLIGWIHYLAFDLLAGLYITKKAEQSGINRFLILPSLLFTFMMGPVGLLLFIVTRWIRSKKLIHQF